MGSPWPPVFNFRPVGGDLTSRARAPLGIHFALGALLLYLILEIQPLDDDYEIGCRHRDRDRTQPTEARRMQPLDHPHYLRHRGSRVGERDIAFGLIVTFRRRCRRCLGPAVICSRVPHAEGARRPRRGLRHSWGSRRWAMGAAARVRRLAAAPVRRAAQSWARALPAAAPVRRAARMLTPALPMAVPVRCSMGVWAESVAQQWLSSGVASCGWLLPPKC